MKFPISLIAILGAVTRLVHGFAVPDTSSAIGVAELTKSTSVGTWHLLSETSDNVTLSERADEDGEWTLILYNNGADGGQCGGVENKLTSDKSNFCEGVTGLVGHVKADMKVGINFGFGKCEFSFRKDGTSCGGQEVGTTTVKKGDSECVAIPDDIRYVRVTCD